jgi:menaquinol-cytochrome c reductase cytochrome b/c subunit
MTEIPEHLLKRSQERRKALGQGGDEPAAEAPAADAPATEAGDGGAVEEPAAASAASDEGAITEDKGGVPAYLLERSRKRKAALTGGDDAGGAAAGGGTATATATRAKAPTMTAGAPTGVGPGGHTQRLLTVVKAGSIQQTRGEAQDKVHTWPHLLSIEFASLLSMTAMVTIFSALVKAPLLGLADVNKTPNPSKAPWYFLGLQELLTMFTPMVAGVTIPGIALGLLAIAPFVDKNPSNKPADRKFAISIFTVFLMFWAVLVIIGSFFRGEGFNFTFPWNSHVFFEL